MKPARASLDEGKELNLPESGYEPVPLNRRIVGGELPLHGIGLYTEEHGDVLFDRKRNPARRADPE